MRLFCHKPHPIILDYIKRNGLLLYKTKEEVDNNKLENTTETKIVQPKIVVTKTIDEELGRVKFIKPEKEFEVRDDGIYKLERVKENNLYDKNVYEYKLMISKEAFLEAFDKYNRGE